MAFKGLLSSLRICWKRPINILYLDCIMCVKQFWDTKTKDQGMFKNILRACKSKNLRNFQYWIKMVSFNVWVIYWTFPLKFHKNSLLIHWKMCSLLISKHLRAPRFMILQVFLKRPYAFLFIVHKCSRHYSNTLLLTGFSLSSSTTCRWGTLASSSRGIIGQWKLCSEKATSHIRAGAPDTNLD